MTRKKTMDSLPAGTTTIESRTIPTTDTHIGGFIHLTYRQDPRTYENTWLTMFERADGEVAVIHDFGYDRAAAEADLEFRAARGS